MTDRRSEADARDEATEPTPPVAEKANGRRSRGNFGLRVPDDEVARPDVPAASPSSPISVADEGLEMEGRTPRRGVPLDPSEAERTLPMKAIPVPPDTDMLPESPSEPNVRAASEGDGFPRPTTQKRPRLGGPAALAALLEQTRNDPPSTRGVEPKRERSPAMVAPSELGVQSLSAGSMSSPHVQTAVAAPAPPPAQHLVAMSPNLIATPAVPFTPMSLPKREASERPAARLPSGEFDIPVDEDEPEEAPAKPEKRVSSPPSPPVAAVAERRSPTIPPRPPIGIASSPNLSAASNELHSATVPALAKPSAYTGRESPIAPPMASEASLSKKKTRGWWEDFFNEDFLRATPRLTEDQVQSEALFIEESLGVERGARVLDLACGTGRHAIELSKRGYDVVGFDLSLAMLARAGEEAQAKGRKVSFVQGDMRDMTFDEHFDGIYCWNTSFGFFEEDKNALVVTKMHRALKSGGLLLLDVANRDFLARQAPSLVWFEGDGCVCMDEMQVDWITSRVRVKRTMMIEDGRSRETEYSIRAYALHELGKLLHDHGFKVLEVSGSIATPGVFFGADSPRTIILAEKR